MKRALYALDDLYRRYVYERPSPRYRQQLIRSSSHTDFQKKAEELCRNGVLLLPAYFPQPMIEAMRMDFDRWAEGKEPDAMGRLFLNEKNGAFLRASAPFSRAAADPFLTGLIRYYWGKPIFLAHSVGFRLEPRPDGTRVGSFRWHHDANRKQIKLMIYLADVPSNGQRMDYLPGTHRLWHHFQRGEAGYEASRFSDEAVAQYGPPFGCGGPAGTALLFDTNGLHRGNQNPTVRREVWVLQYTAGRNMERFSGLHPEVVQGLEPACKSIARSS